jgi:hypothetical protein
VAENASVTEMEYHLNVHSSRRSRIQGPARKSAAL